MICQIHQLGRVPYRDALEVQRQAVMRRKAGEVPDLLLLLEHPHVYTMGRSARREHLLISEQRLQTLGAELFETDRGGDITYHGPGQVVGYPILDLKQHHRDVAWYMRALEEVLIQTVADFGGEAGRRAGSTGVWAGEEKLASLGVHLSRWVTSHGFALNVNTDLTYFDYIVPCGLKNVRVTSLEELTGRRADLESVGERIIGHFAEVFGVEFRHASPVMDSTPAGAGADSHLEMPRPVHS